jgi:hypothetical protein
MLITGSTVPAAETAATQPSGPYSEAIPGSTVSIDMVPVPAGEFKADGKDAVAIKPLYASK